MKKLREGFRAMKTAKKVETIAALILTLAIIAGVPVLAWLATTTKVEVLTRIRKPDNLDIRAGNGDLIVNFHLRDIDVAHTEEDALTESRYYVFSVNAGGNKARYYIQVAHTTNIPFTYKLYSATKQEDDDVKPGFLSTVYRSLEQSTEEPGTTYQFKTKDLLAEENKGITLNGDNSQYGRQLGKNNDSYYSKTYNQSDDDPQIYAIPVYHQTGVLARNDNDTNQDQYDYFVLELVWNTDEVSDEDPFKAWNEAKNNKETDIIYISAAKATDQVTDVIHIPIDD